MKATEMMRQDLRRLRIQPLLHEILLIVDKHLTDDEVCSKVLRDLHHELFDKFCDLGVEIVTDETRAQLGLPPRGPDGWTDDEVRAMELKRLELLSRPTPIIFSAPLVKHPN